jgi:hypothetical protein
LAVAQAAILSRVMLPTASPCDNSRGETKARKNYKSRVLKKILQNGIAWVGLMGRGLLGLSRRRYPQNHRLSQHSESVTESGEHGFAPEKTNGIAT